MSPLLLVLLCFFGALAMCWLAWSICETSSREIPEDDDDYTVL